MTKLLPPHLPVALFQPDGQRLCVQADQQLYQLFYAWRPKGTLILQTVTAYMQTNCTTASLYKSLISGFAPNMF